MPIITLTATLAQLPSSPMNLADMLKDVLDQLPDQRREAVEQLVKEYGARESCHFTLALLAGANSRERRLSRLLLNELERQDVEDTD
ncbi:MAG: hypothetical protein VX733_14685 [Candidatus Latescibacterota bacterium]|nr:hypothetical protein [Candidatus Latescibacterota bacterium]